MQENKQIEQGLSHFQFITQKYKYFKDSWQERKNWCASISLIGRSTQPQNLSCLPLASSAEYDPTSVIWGGTVASLFLGIVQPQVYPFCLPPLQLEALLYLQAGGMLTLKSRNQGQCPCWLVGVALLFCCLPCRMIKLSLIEEKWTKPLNWPRFERDFFIAVRESHRHGDRMKSITAKRKKIVEMGLFTLKRLKMNHELSLNKLTFSTSA